MAQISTWYSCLMPPSDMAKQQTETEFFLAEQFAASGSHSPKLLRKNAGKTFYPCKGLFCVTVITTVHSSPTPSNYGAHRVPCGPVAPRAYVV